MRFQEQKAFKLAVRYFSVSLVNDITGFVILSLFLGFGVAVLTLFDLGKTNGLNVLLALALILVGMIIRGFVTVQVVKALNSTG